MSPQHNPREGRVSTSNLGKWDLGKRLKQFRMDQGMTLDELAEASGLPRMRVHRVEHGNWSRMYMPEFLAILEGLGVQDPDLRTDLVGRWEVAKQGGWWEEKRYAPAITGAYLPFEAAAANISGLEYLTVPGLLQSEEYMRALDGRTPEDAHEVYVASRIQRQEAIFSRPDKPGITLVFHEQALTATVPLGIAADQARRIIELLDAYPNLVVQVIENGSPLEPPFGRSYAILDFATTDMSVVYSEAGIKADYVEDPDTVNRYRRYFVLACGTALSPSASRDLISRYAG